MDSNGIALCLRTGVSARGVIMGVLVAGVTALSGAGSAALAQSFAGVGLLPEGSQTNARSLSADGSTAVGSASIPAGERAFRWTTVSGLQDLGALPFSTASRALDVSGDGTVAVGVSTIGSHGHAFRWRGSDGMLDLGLFPGGTYAWAYAVSSDGLVVVGYGDSSEGPRAFRWTSAEGMQNLGVLPGDDRSSAHGVSSDGSVIAGTSALGLRSHVFRWTASGGLENLDVPAGLINVGVTDMSDDGSTIVGWGSGEDHALHAWRWTREGGMQHLADLIPDEPFAQAYGVNADGSVMVGQSQGRAVLWYPTGQPVDLEVRLQSLGVDLDGWQLIEARGVSADGLTIIGNGINPKWEQGGQAWIATIRGCAADFNHNFLINSQDFFDFLNAFFAAEPAADFNADGIVNSNDFFDYLTAFVAGCP